MTKVVPVVVVLFLCVTQVVMTCTELSERLSGSVFQKLRLSGSTYVVKSSRTQYHCAMQCMYDAICASFNYDTATSSCELNCETSTTTPRQVVNAPGWINANAESFPQVLSLSVTRLMNEWVDADAGVKYDDWQQALVLNVDSGGRWGRFKITTSKTGPISHQITRPMNRTNLDVIFSFCKTLVHVNGRYTKSSSHRPTTTGTITLSLIGPCAHHTCLRGSVCTYGGALSQCVESDRCVTGTMYLGSHNITKYGRTCQRWDSHTPHGHFNMFDSPSNMQTITSMEEAGNRCLTESNDTMPWCYSTDPMVPWEYCSVPQC